MSDDGNGFDVDLSVKASAINFLFNIHLKVSMAKKVNIDALIPREDFEVKDSKASPTSKSPYLRVSDLVTGSFFFESLRKPDFQRESNEWDHWRVFSLIKSFLNADLIPAVIL